MLVRLDQLSGKHVVVMGLGLNQGGVGTATFFAERGAHVLVTDLKSREELAPSIAQLRPYEERGLIEYVLGEHRAEDFSSADLVMKNPGVPLDSPYIAAAVAAGVPVESDTALFFEWCSRPIIGVTGTKGKTTTTALISHFMKAQFADVVTAGNLQVSQLEALGKVGADSQVVLELSSFGLETLKSHRKSPHIACFTNFFADHLNRYASLDDYFEAKAQLFLFQTPEDWCVLNAESEFLQKNAARAKSRIVWFASSCAQGAHVCVRDGWFCATRLTSTMGDHLRVALVSALQLVGAHNVQNALAAIATALCAGVTPEHIAEALPKFTGVSFRIERRREVDGVVYINDTASTVPESTRASLEAISQPIVLISGGSDKGLNIDTLAQTIVHRAKAVVLLPGNATTRLEGALRDNLNLFHKSMDITRAGTMREAVDAARALAKPGDAVVLSPGLTSFGLFQNEFDRGRQFNDAVEKLHAAV